MICFRYGQHGHRVETCPKKFRPHIEPDQPEMATENPQDTVTNTTGLTEDALWAIDAGNTHQKAEWAKKKERPPVHGHLGRPQT